MEHPKGNVFASDNAAAQEKKEKTTQAQIEQLYIFLNIILSSDYLLKYFITQVICKYVYM